MKKILRNKSVIFFAAAIFGYFLSGCQSDAQSPAVTSEISGSTAPIVFSDTDNKTAAAEESSEAEAPETAEENIPLPEAVTVFGNEYLTSENNPYITVDADIFKEITDNDTAGIEVLKKTGLQAIKVYNCKNNRPEFLSEITGVNGIEFYDMTTAENNTAFDFEWLKSFTDFKYMNFIDIDGNTSYISGNYLDRMSDSKLKNANFYVRDFSPSDAATTVMTQNISCTYNQLETYGEYYSCSPEKPYIISTPYISLYDNNDSAFYYTDNSHDKISPDSSTAAAYFCNPTDTEIFLHDFSVYSSDGNFISWGEIGNSFISINETVPPKGEYCFEFSPDDLLLDRQKGLYGLYELKFYYSIDPDEDLNDWEYTKSCMIINSSESRGLDGLTPQKREVFEKALRYMQNDFSVSHQLSEEYAASHTADEFTDSFTDAFTYDYAKELTAPFLDENGMLKAISSDRGGDITLAGSCFETIQAYEGTYVICYSIHYHPDIMQRAQAETTVVKIVPENSVPRVSYFGIWW